MKSINKTRGRRGVLHGIFYGVLALLGYPVLRFVGFTLPRKPVQVQVEQSVPSRSGILARDDFFLFDRNGKNWAVSRRCTHLGCRVNYREEGNFLECPCHQSRFRAEDGAVLHGPALRPLPLYPVEKRSGGYVVSIRS